MKKYKHIILPLLILVTLVTAYFAFKPDIEAYIQKQKDKNKDGNDTTKTNTNDTTTQTPQPPKSPPILGNGSGQTTTPSTSKNKYTQAEIMAMIGKCNNSKSQNLILKKGMKCAEVVALQVMLNDILAKYGMPYIGVDGVFGSETANALSLANKTTTTLAEVASYKKNNGI